MIIPNPSQVPAKGFYYNFKHDPNGPVNNYAYEVVGVGVHTEEACNARDANMVAYIPLYDCPVADQLNLFYLRPLPMWKGEVEVEGKTVPRFTLITDPCIIAQLKKIRAMLYGRM